MPPKDTSWIESSGLYGTWTFTTETMTDVGYYKGVAYVVLHLMPDPMSVKSCAFRKGGTHPHCLEATNHACGHGEAKGNEKEICVNLGKSDLEWSDVTAFFQFGFVLREGIVKKTYHRVKVSDWLGPYNMILAPVDKKHSLENSKTEKQLYVSRYVRQPWTSDRLQRPFTTSPIFNYDEHVMETIVGMDAINTTIQEQIHWMGNGFGDDNNSMEEDIQRHLRWDSAEEIKASMDGSHNDPYARYAKSCAHGDLKPILPKIEVERTTKTTPAGPDNTPPAKKHTTYSMKVDYSILSVPIPGVDDLYKKLPSFKSHLGGNFPLTGPYCFGKDPNRAYSIRLSYDSSPEKAANQIWKGIKGCDPSWPCWSNDLPGPAPSPSAKIPTDNGVTGSYVLDPMGVEAAILYGMGFLLVVSLLFNMTLANRLKRAQRSRVGTPHQQEREATLHPEDPRRGMEEPLLNSASDDDLLMASFDHLRGDA